MMTAAIVITNRNERKKSKEKKKCDKYVPCDMHGS